MTSVNTLLRITTDTEKDIDIKSDQEWPSLMHIFDTEKIREENGVMNKGCFPKIQQPITSVLFITRHKALLRV